LLMKLTIAIVILSEALHQTVRGEAEESSKK